MAQDDGFDLWLGRVGQDRPLGRHFSAARARSGRRGNGKPGKFTGARIGRGSGAGRILASRGSNAQARRVVVKARIVRLAGKGLGAARAHLRYLERDGTTREGSRGALYGPGDDNVDGKAFLERGAGDRHQFRFIVSPEDGDQYDDLKPLVRRLMERAEQDLGTKLDWVAVDHFNTGQSRHLRCRHLRLDWNRRLFAANFAGESAYYSCFRLSMAGGAYHFDGRRRRHEKARNSVSDQTHSASKRRNPAPDGRLE